MYNTTIMIIYQLLGGTSQIEINPQADKSCECTILSLMSKSYFEMINQTKKNIKTTTHMILYGLFFMYVILIIYNKQFKWYSYIVLIVLLIQIYHVRNNHINKPKDLILIFFIQFYYYICILPIVYYSFSNYFTTLFQVAITLLVFFIMYNYITWSQKTSWFHFFSQIVIILLSLTNLISAIKKIIIIYPMEQIRYNLYIITGGPALDVECAIRYATWYDYLGIIYRYIKTRIISIDNALNCYNMNYFRENDSRRYHFKGYIRVKITEYLNQQNPKLLQELRSKLITMELPQITKECEGVYYHVSAQQVEQIRQQLLNNPIIKNILQKHNNQSLLTI